MYNEMESEVQSNAVHRVRQKCLKMQQSHNNTVHEIVTKRNESVTSYKNGIDKVNATT